MKKGYFNEKAYWWQAAASAAGSGIGMNLLRNSQDRARMGEAHDWSVEDAWTERAWQEKMSNSAHQRETKDLEAAGLNRILSAQGGASTPGGAMPTVSKSNAESSDAVSSAVDAARLSKEMKAVDAQIKVADSTALAQQAQANRDNTSAKNTAVQTAIMEKTAPATIKRSDVELKKAIFDEKAVNYDNYMKRIGEGVGIINNAREAITPRIRLETQKKGTMLIDSKTGEILKEKK